jgi:N-methylhydantoinase A
MELIRSIDMRYNGQAYEIPISITNDMLDKSDIDMINENFHNEHLMLYGYNRKQDAVEVVNIRLTALGKLPKVELLKETNITRSGVKPIGERDVYMRDCFVKTQIYDRALLTPGTVIHGPAIIEQLDSTTVIFPDQISRVDDYGNIIISGRGG